MRYTCISKCIHKRDLHIHITQTRQVPAEIYIPHMRYMDLFIYFVGLLCDIHISLSKCEFVLFEICAGLSFVHTALFFLRRKRSLYWTLLWGSLLDSSVMCMGIFCGSLVCGMWDRYICDIYIYLTYLTQETHKSYPYTSQKRYIDIYISQYTHVWVYFVGLLCEINMWDIYISHISHTRDPRNIPIHFTDESKEIEIYIYLSIYPCMGIFCGSLVSDKWDIYISVEIQTSVAVYCSVLQCIAVSDKWDIYISRYIYLEIYISLLRYRRVLFGTCVWGGYD